MFNSKRKKSKNQPRKEILVADGRTAATIPIPGGMVAKSLPESSMSLDYVLNAATSQSITWRQILDTVVFASSSTVGYDLFYSAKVHYVDIWTPPTTFVALGAPSLAFDSPSQGDQKVYNIPVGPQGGYCRCKPSMRTINGLTWQSSSSVTCFTLNSLSAGTYLRISVTFRARQGSPVAAQNALSSATTGAIYLRGLDGLAKASSVFNCVPYNYQI